MNTKHITAAILAAAADGQQVPGWGFQTMTIEVAPHLERAAGLVANLRNRALAAWVNATPEAARPAPSSQVSAATSTTWAKAGAEVAALTWDERKCRRCAGTGMTRHHQDGGVCYGCGGTGRKRKKAK